MPIHAMARMLADQASSSRGRRSIGSAAPSKPTSLLAAVGWQTSLLLLALLVGCVGSAAPRLQPPGAAVRTALAAGPWQLHGGPWQQVVALRPAQQTCLIIQGCDAAPVALALDAAAREALQQFVSDGGRLLLFGEACCLLAAFGADVVVPEPSRFRWGYDARATYGRAQLGLELLHSSAEPWFAGLLPVAPDGVLYWLHGGTPCDLGLARWPVQPLRGEVLARLQIETDGWRQPGGEPGLVRLACGRGEVLACGLPLALDHGDPLLRENSRALLQGMLAAAAPQRVCYAELPVTPPPPSASTLSLDLAARELPQAPQLAHAGWQLGWSAAAPAPAAILDQLLLPAWRAGGNLLAVEVPAHAAGLLWSTNDPLPAPAGLSTTTATGWSAQALGGFAAEAHARGMLFSAAVPGPTVPGNAKEQFGALRFLARELGCWRRLGDRAVDGLALQQWPRDPLGIGAAMWEDYQPQGYLLHTGELGAAAAGALRGLHGDDGRLPGWSLQGLGQGFRDGFRADRFPAGVLQAGSEDAPDWLVAQGLDFIRARREQGGALWLRLPELASMPGGLAEHARALLQEPLYAAFAMPLTATGQDGQRAAVARLLGLPPAALGALVAAPAATHVLQNNWLRLSGSGGALHWDAGGLGRFDATARLLSPGLLRTRLFGGRPDAQTFRTELCDFLQLGARPAGGYMDRCEVAWPLTPGAQPPAQLATGMAPSWPARVDLQLPPWLGYCELRLRLRGTEGATVCQVQLDQLVLRCVPVQAGERSEEITVPVHLARSGPRRLSLLLREPGALAIDLLQLRRLGDVAAEASVAIAGGSVAAVCERSLSSYHQERLELRTLADWPGIILHSRCDRAVQNLQLERTLCLPGYRELPDAPAQPPAKAPLLALRHSHPDAPDLVVIALEWPRYDRLTRSPEGLQWRCLPEPGSETTLALLFCDRRYTQELLRHGRAILGGLDPRAAFELGDRGELTVVADLPLPTTRLLHLRQRAETPYAVCERGYWTWRGAQPAPGGGDWLRIAVTPGDTVRVRGGPALLAMTRPAPGSLHLLAIREPTANSAIVKVLQPGRLTAPGIVFAADFDEVLVDGKPWAWFAGRTVHLPDRPGTYVVTTRQSRRGQPAAPRVAATRAPLQQCYFDAAAGCLVLATAADPARPASLPYTAILCGPRPSRVDHGELVEDHSLRFPDPAVAAAGGILLRFRAGTTRVFYGDVP